VRRWELISQLIKHYNLKSGAELGVWKGATFKYLADRHPDVLLYGVDLYAAQPDNKGPERWVAGENGHEWDHDKYRKDLEQFCSARNNCTLMVKSTREASNYIVDGSLDFVFIDADHSYEGVTNDLRWWVPKVREGGLIIGHDIDWDGVKRAVEMRFGNNYFVSPDNCWWLLNPPHEGGNKDKLYNSLY